MSDESEQFTSIDQKASKHRGSQLLAVLAVVVTVVGGLLAIAGHWFGFVLLFGGLAALVAIMVWSLKNWDF
jgi:uncharacterized membrane protein